MQKKYKCSTFQSLVWFQVFQQNTKQNKIKQTNNKENDFET